MICQKGKQQFHSYQKHTPSSFCYYIKCYGDNVYTKDPVTYTAKTNDEDVAQKFIEMLEEDVKKIYKIPEKEMIFGEKEREDFRMLDLSRQVERCDRVRDHYHYTGKNRGAAHNKCNLKYKKPSFTPASQGNIKCITNNEEKSIRFTKELVIN